MATVVARSIVTRTSASGFPSAPSRIRPDNVATCVGGVGVGVGSGEGVVAGTGPGVLVGAVVSDAVGVGAVAVPPQAQATSARTNPQASRMEGLARQGVCSQSSIRCIGRIRRNSVSDAAKRTQWRGLKLPALRIDSGGHSRLD